LHMSLWRYHILTFLIKQTSVRRFFCRRSTLLNP
jgi:hypothetical protein